MNQIASCVFDLETTNLNADFGIILCGVVKSSHGKPQVFRGDRLNPKWSTKRSDDSHVLKALVEELEKYDIWIAHNGQKFDIPYLRSRLLKFGFPSLANKKLIDPCHLARNKLKISYNSLEKIANHMGCNSKTDLDPDIWLKASLDGCRRSMDEVCRHCVEDVITLEKVINYMKTYCTAFNSYGSSV